MFITQTYANADCLLECFINHIGIIIAVTSAATSPTN